jgi:hypothetical protein
LFITISENRKGKQETIVKLKYPFSPFAFYVSILDVLLIIDVEATIGYD